ncbi:amidase [Phenylobacterium montanum]|uniref:Amidase domain-containing protein n=1 Tax=Phenylobacterium montanum TaxID=2823693 RepID=A0A975G4E9_9CAUL|nr:amidase family protein [Caulobacter sp. S6]QUD89831.1 hypothetical protein KCG34_08160 [Caulobacter sp. S6]
MSEDICFKPAVELAALIRHKAISPVEVVDAVIARAEAVNPAINGFITESFDLARDAAVEVERQLMANGPESLGRLAGIPVSIKDLTPTAGIRTTFGVHEYADHVPEEDAPIVRRIREAGAVLIGKSSSPPFGWLGVTENELIGRTNNPWDVRRSVGGSSGGSAALVAAGVGPLATGSDGGGSIRLPAALCGVVGHKPSHGRVPRGVEAQLFETVDALGPMTRTVADAALLLSVMAGPVEEEPYMLPEEGVDYVAELRASTSRGLRIAFSPDLGHGPVDREVAEIISRAAKHFEQALGARVDEVQIEIPDPMEYFETFWAPQVSSVRDMEPGVARLWERYPILSERRVGMTSQPADEWWRVVTSARQATFMAFATLFRRYDVLLTPTSPVPAWIHNGALGPEEIEGQKVKYPVTDFFRYTEPFGHSCHPAITINCGFTSAGLPVGLQIAGPQRDDRGVLRAAAAYEATTDWHTRRPSI